MDFVRLGAAYSTGYYPDMLIEGYNSLIWTERYNNTPGQFELKTWDLSLEDVLAEGTLVSHLETREVMAVETHSIQDVGEGADARPELTIVGRSVTSIFEHRWVEGTYQKKRRMRTRYTATSAAAVLMYNVVDNASGKDLTRGDTDPDTELENNDYAWTTKDRIPNVCITESVASEGTTRWWGVTEGILYPQLMKILDDADLGLRAIRPSSPTPGKVITVSSALSTRGQVTRTDTADITSLQFNIYQGVDRSNTVKFSQLQGHLDKPQYLRSNANYKNALEVMSDKVSLSDIYRPGDENLTGWRRRVMGFDAGSPDLPPEPERPEDPAKNATAAQINAWKDDIDKWKSDRAKWRNKCAPIIEDFKEEQALAALRELKKARRINMFSGDVSELAPYKYKVHYDLGDIVTLVGDNNQTQKMMVSEYVRTEDANGDRGFPGLVVP